MLMAVLGIASNFAGIGDLKRRIVAAAIISFILGLIASLGIAFGMEFIVTTTGINIPSGVTAFPLVFVAVVIVYLIEYLIGEAIAEFFKWLLSLS